MAVQQLRDNIRPFVQVVFSLQGKSDAGIEEIVQKIKIEMNINEETIMEMKEVPEVMLISNAGLCLLAPWFVRLFSMPDTWTKKRKSSKTRPQRYVPCSCCIRHLWRRAGIPRTRTGIQPSAHSIAIACPWHWMIWKDRSPTA